MNDLIVSLNEAGRVAWPRLAAVSLELVVFVLLVIAVIHAVRLRSASVRQWLWRLSLAKPLVALLIVSPAPFLVLRSLMPSDNETRLAAEANSAATRAFKEHHAPNTANPMVDEAEAPPVASAPRLSGIHDGATNAVLSETPDSTAGPVVPSAANKTKANLPEIKLTATGWAVVVWLGVAIALLLRLAAGFLYIGRLRATAAQPDSRVEGLESEAAETLGCRSIPVGLSDRIGSPTLTGILRPMILLPRPVVETLNDDQIRQILIHETAHATRWDNLFLAGQRFIESVFFFHPFVWLCGARLRRDTEDACDDIALRAGGNPTLYADSLTRVAELCVDSQNTWRLAATGAEMNFSRRLARIIEGRAGGSSRLTGLAAACLVALALVGLPSHISHGRTAAEDQPEKADVIRLKPGRGLQKVIEAAPANATLRLAAGTYEGFFRITKPLTIEGAGSDKTILFAQFEELADLPPVVDIQDTTAKIKGLRVRTVVPARKGGTQSYAAVRINASEVDMSDCAVVGWSGRGVAIEGDSNVKMANCLVAACWGTGVTIAKTAPSAPKVLLRDCDVRNCYYAGVGIGRGCDAVRIEGCRISGAAWHGIRYDDASPEISGNLIFENARLGVYASGKTKAKVTGNVFYNNEMGGIWCVYYNQDVIEQNTFVANQREGLSVTGASEPVVRKNVFFGNPTAVAYGRQQGMESVENAHRLVAQNLYWNNENNLTLPPSQKADGSYETEKREAELDDNSVVADPLFKDAEGRDFSLRAESRALKMAAGAKSVPSYASPWPLQNEEKAIIPDGPTRDCDQWKEPPPPGASTKAEVPALFGRGGDKPYDWQNAEFVPPSPKTFFPYDRDAGTKLDELYRAADRDRRSDEEILQAVRDGFLAASVDHGQLVSWLGNRYIWGKSPQHPAAIEIMYHAIHLGKGDPLYFGLSVVTNKSDNILRVLAEIAMKSDDPNVLSRIAWGCSSQSQEAIRQLKPYLESGNPATKEKAEAVRGMLEGKIKAFEWAGSQARPRVRAIEAEHKPKMPEYKEKLLKGDSKTRMKTLRDMPMYLADDSFVEAMLACAEDPDSGVRAELARSAGGHWVWSPKDGVQNKEIIRMMLKLGRDENRQVRYNAVYFGLSTVQEKTEPIVRFLLELALNDLEWNNHYRITWGLGWGADKKAVKSVMDEILERPMDSLFDAACAYLLYQETVKEEPADFAWTEKIKKAYPDDKYAIMIQAKPPFEPKSQDELQAEFRKAISQSKIPIEFGATHDSRVMDKTQIYVRGEEQTKAIEKAIDESPTFVRGDSRKVAFSEQLIAEAMQSEKGLTRFTPELPKRLEAIAEKY